MEDFLRKVLKLYKILFMVSLPFLFICLPIALIEYYAHGMYGLLFIITIPVGAVWFMKVFDKISNGV